MKLFTILSLLVAGTTAQTTGCYCSSHSGCTSHSGCSCAFSEAGCAAAGASWYTGSACSCNAINSANTATAGCYNANGNHVCDCTVSEQSCTGTWMTSGCSSCAAAASPPAATPAASPSSSTSSTPPSPPEPCVVPEGTELPATTAASPDPINEPCYSHSSCASYSGDGSGYICCVEVGTCDNMHSSGMPMVSNSQRYYVGGCRGVNYRRSTPSNASIDAGETTFPSTDEGCVKQGECQMVFLEQDRDWTAGGGLVAGELPRATLELLLTGAVSTPEGACEDAYLPASGHQVVFALTLQADISSFTTTVVETMKNNLAQEMRVNPANVVVTVAPGSVVVTITVTTSTAAQATAIETGATGAGGPLENAAAASATLTAATGGTLTITVDPNVAIVARSATQSSSSSDDGLATGALIGIVVGAAIVIVAIAAIVYMTMCKEKVHSAPAKGQA